VIGRDFDEHSQLMDVAYEQCIPERYAPPANPRMKSKNPNQQLSNFLDSQGKGTRSEVASVEFLHAYVSVALYE
jgi:hypothetical protein